MKLILVVAAALAQGEPESAARGTVAGAQATADAAGAIAYPASFFVESRANTAFEMLQRLPGFTYNGGAEMRGFAGAAGNVLIDGERPSSKSVSLEDVLRRLPATSVERIDLIRGGAPGIDMQGQPLVANVIRSRSALGTTTVTSGLRAFWDGRIAPQADLEVTRRRGALSLEGAVRAIWEVDPESGDGAQTLAAPTGALIESGPFAHRERGRTLSANGAALLTRRADVWRLNFGAEDQLENTRQRLGINDAAGRPLSAFSLTERRTARQLEAGGDYEHTFSDSLSARILALHTMGRGSSLERAEEAGGVQTSDEFTRTRESIVRGSLTAQRSSALTVEAGGEGALNVLDSRNGVTVDGLAVDLPNANVRVQERRAEGFVTAFWKPSARLSLEGGGRVETSRITQSGDSQLAKSFFFPKPRVVLTYTPDPASQVRLRLQREVGQLDFGDFAAAAELGAGTVNAGNADLEPERSWVFEVALERRFWGKGVVSLTFTHAEVQQVLDLLPIDGRFDAPGNIGDGRREQIKLNATLPLDRLGLKGGLITGEANWRRSKVTDPVTGRPRPISELRPFDGQVRFSHDIAALQSTWGLIGDLGYSETQYRIDEVRRVSYQTYWTAYWEWKPGPALSVRAEVQNLASRDFRRLRHLYAGPRSLDVLDAIERRNARFDPFFYLRVRRAL